MPIVQLQAMAGNAAVTTLLRPIVVQRVQLTYDDGPDEGGQTQKAVDELQASGARATFYLVGKRVQKGDNWKTVFNIAASGSWVGNHAFDWNDASDNHIFLSGTKEERGEKMLMTELAIRDALIKGKNDAVATTQWEKIPPMNQHYIEDVIANGTGRFRTPGFKTHYIVHPFSDEGKTQNAINELNDILGASGLRRFEQSDSVDIDMKDWEKVDKGKPSARPKTQAEIEKAYIDELNSKNDPKASILLHSRLPASVAASPKIIEAIRKKGWDFSAEPRGGFDDIVMKAPKHEELVKARSDFLANPGSTAAEAADQAVVILQKAQASRNPDEVNDFIAELESTPVTGTAPAATSTAGTATPTRAPHVVPPTLKEWMYGQKKFQMLFDFFKARNAPPPLPARPAPVPTPSPNKAATPFPKKALAPAMTAPYPPGGAMSKRYWALSPAERADVNAAVDKMFAEQSGMSRPQNWEAASDQPAARAWLRMRDEVMATRQAEPAGVQKLDEMMPIQRQLPTPVPTTVPAVPTTTPAPADPVKEAQALLDEQPKTSQDYAGWILKAHDQGFAEFTEEYGSEAQITKLSQGKKVMSVDPTKAEVIPALLTMYDLVKGPTTRWVAKPTDPKQSVMLGSFIRDSADRHGKGRAVDINEENWTGNADQLISLLKDLSPGHYGLGIPFGGEFIPDSEDLRALERVEAKRDTPKSPLTGLIWDTGWRWTATWDAEKKQYVETTDKDYVTPDVIGSAALKTKLRDLRKQGFNLEVFADRPHHFHIDRR